MKGVRAIQRPIWHTLHHWSARRFHVIHRRAASQTSEAPSQDAREKELRFLLYQKKILSGKLSALYGERNQSKSDEEACRKIDENARAIESDLVRVKSQIDKHDEIRAFHRPLGEGQETLDLPALDKKWQQMWSTTQSETLNSANGESTKEAKRRKAYILPMFPYPSGNLHMGHMRVYTIADVFARWKQMSGYEVLNPMGWDAFGLPAENAAIERGINPASWTKSNISKMRSMLMEMNTGMDWSKELATCDPEFYKHTQRLFLLMLEHGMAYQAEGLVNWDPVDKTVLANEQVDKDGNSWRSGSKVEQRMLKQWYLKVTEFKQSLLDDLDFLARDGRWPERVLAQQRSWIGKSEGAKFKFMVGSMEQGPQGFRPVEVFTTRPDTLLGVQFLAVSASHPLVLEQVPKEPELRKFLAESASLPPDSKAGYRLKGVVAVNPVVTLTKTPDGIPTSVPVFVAPYVLEGYGEGAVMGVPGHDDRDYSFWRLNSPTDHVVRVVGPADGQPIDLSRGAAFTETGKLLPECGKFAGLTSAKAGAQFVSQLGMKKLSEKSETWRLRDWLISRQRYWGTPIPVIHCKSCGAVPVPAEELPVTLPELTGGHFKGKTGNPLEKAEDWVNVKCPSCNGPAKRDTDTMDTFVDSSWYFMRFPDPNNKQELFSKQHADDFLPVDMYIGGVEHATLHLLYARFVSKFLTSISMWPKGKKLSLRGEPFDKLITQGMVHGKTYSDPKTGRFLRPEEVDLTSPNTPKMTGTDVTPTLSFEKMSKSKHNGVDPTALIRKHGADVVRTHTLFSAPIIDVLDWDDAKIAGASRWLSRVWRHVIKASNRLTPNVQTFAASKVDHAKMHPQDQSSWKAVQDLLTSINQAYEAASLNTLVSDLMKLTGILVNNPAVSVVVEYHRTSALLRAMAPVAPALAEECWQLLHAGKPTQKSIFGESFPQPDHSVVVVEETQTCTIQQNGKLRFSVQIPVVPEGVETVDEWVVEKLKATDAGARWFEDKGSEWKRIVVVRGGKIVNFVR